MKKIAVCYHKGCLDGFGGAYAAWKKFGSRADYIGLEHQETVPKELKGRTLYFIDFCYPTPVMKKVIAANKKVIILDHHESQVDAIRLVPEFRYTTDNSGCVIAWKYFHPNAKIPYLLDVIEDNDLFRFNNSETHRLIAALQFCDQTFSSFDTIAKSLETKRGRKEMLRDGSVLLNAEDSMIGRLVQRAEKVTFEGYGVYAVNTPLFYSHSANVISHEKKVPFGITWFYREGKLQVSLRTYKKGVDVSLLAKKYGGGGHKGAAGFSYEYKGAFPWEKV
ncbi:MAG: DHH family phosphoesterase [Patescibacteria group bacterium]